MEVNLSIFDNRGTLTLDSSTICSMHRHQNRVNSAGARRGFSGICGTTFYSWGGQKNDGALAPPASPSLAPLVVCKRLFNVDQDCFYSAQRFWDSGHIWAQTCPINFRVVLKYYQCHDTVVAQDSMDAP